MGVWETSVEVWKYGSMGVWEYGRDSLTLPHFHTSILSSYLF